MKPRPQRVQAAVKWYDSTKGYGFLERSGDKDVFFHVSALRNSGIDDDPEPGDVMEFDLIPVEKKNGFKAVNLKLLTS